MDHLSLPNRKLKHYTTLRRFCREFMQIFRDCVQYQRYSRTYQKRKCPICKSTFYRSPDEQDRVLTQCFCCTRRSKFCPSCFETVPSIPEEILRVVGITDRDHFFALEKYLFNSLPYQPPKLPTLITDDLDWT